MIKYILVLEILFSALLFAQTERDELFLEVEAQLNQAKLENADVLCAEAYANAVSEYMDANKFATEKKSPVDIREKLESSISYLTKINNNIEGKEEQFASTIAKRNSAIDSEAYKKALYYWELGENKFQQAIEEYEDGEMQLIPQTKRTAEEYYTNAKLYANKAKALINSESVKEAVAKNAPIFAPTSYKRAEENMFETLDLISSGKRMSEVSKSITDTELLFDMASINAAKFRDEYPELVRLREDAKLADAEKYTFETWKEAEELLRDAAEEFEDEDFENANELSQEASEKFLAAKQTSLKDYFLKEAKEEIDLAVEEGAEEFAPKTLKQSQDYFSEVNSLIENDTYSLHEIKKLTNDAYLYAKTARRITEIAKRMEPGDEPWEDIILSREGYLTNNEEEVKDVPEDSKENPEYSELVKKLQTNVENEIEIDYVENVLTLRLKNVTFATMSSYLNEKSKKSLDKVFSEIKDESFSEATIVCYTDNVGTKSTNKAISQKRAESILNYIIKIDDTHKYYFEGRGEENPIASNSTLKGRKKNRRVEIEIR